MIYTVTFNPAIDYIAQADSITFGDTNRSYGEEIYFGGKGINVSCVLKELDTDTTALGFVAGFTGEALENHLKNRGIKTDFVKLQKGFTRINVKLKGDDITEINGAGPEITKEDLDALFLKLEKISKGDTLVLSGSIPKCLPEDIYEQIMGRLTKRGIRFVVDAEGDLLLNTLKYKPFLIKPNLAEISAIFKKELKNNDEIISAAKEFQNMGAENVIVTMGSKGAVLLDKNGNITERAAYKINAVNTVGAGDSMVAGFLAGIEKGYEFALNSGSAAATATAGSMGLATAKEIALYLA